MILGIGVQVSPAVSLNKRHEGEINLKEPHEPSFRVVFYCVAKQMIIKSVEEMKEKRSTVKTRRPTKYAHSFGIKVTFQGETYCSIYSRTVVYLSRLSFIVLIRFMLLNLYFILHHFASFSLCL